MPSLYRPVSFMAAVSLVFAGCGDGDNGDGPDNEAPTAAFTFSCNALTCSFTDVSTDPDGNDDITAWEWDFGGDGTSDQPSPFHTFTTAGNREVTLIITDTHGATSSQTQAVTVSRAPTAEFISNCNALTCNFTDMSTDPDGNDDITAWGWDFGDPASPDNTSGEQNPTHSYTYTELTEVTVTLTVTDATGNQATTTQTFEVLPAANLECEDGLPNCELFLEDNASVVATLTSRDCELSGYTFKVFMTPPGGTPVTETLFTDGCDVPVGTEFDLQSNAIFEAGTVITAQLISGGHNLEPPPTFRVRALSAYPEWVLEFDDGAIGPETDPNEPDFNDLVITITATPQP